MLPREIFKQVRQIHIRTSRLVNDVFAGQYHSAFKGQGMEFAEVREYVPGDDVRSIDWNVTARLGQPFIKRYVEERELTVMLLVDLSASGQFGSVRRLKTEIATELCAVLALSAITNNDKVGLILFTDRIEKFIPPQKGKHHVLRVIREVLFLQPQQRGTDVGLALEYLHSISRRHAVSFLISDFLARDYEKPLRIANRRHDIIPVSITDRREAELPRIGLLRLEDLESGACMVIDTGSAAVRQAYQQRQQAAVRQRRQLFQSLGIDAIEVRTDEPYIKPMMRFFRRRERRR
ncbi:MAG: DUF58 domain-containing protein [bacterium]|nr:DUF58 domain-containing protein [bacterium]